ncbi:hypothetical protein SprV_0301361800 [Sparganum proliferum]
MGQLARWQEFLQDFDFECQYRPGHKRGNADAFSRFPDTSPPDLDSNIASVNVVTMFGHRARHCGRNPPCVSGHGCQRVAYHHPQVAQSLTTPRRPTSGDRSLRAASGTAIPVSATVLLQLTIENTRISHRFLVTPDGPWPLVLGLDFLEAHDCAVHVRERHLVLGQSTTTSVPPITVDDFDLMYNSVLAAVALDPIPLDTVLSSRSLVGPVAHDHLKTLLNSFPDLLAWSTDTIGRTHLIQRMIDTRDAKPVWQPPRRIPVRYREEVNKLLDELLQAKIIQPSSSPWASPIALVPKKD